MLLSVSVRCFTLTHTKVRSAKTGLAVSIKAFESRVCQRVFSISPCPVKCRVPGRSILGSGSHHAHVGLRMDQPCGQWRDAMDVHLHGSLGSIAHFHMFSGDGFRTRTGGHGRSCRSVPPPVQDANDRFQRHDHPAQAHGSLPCYADRLRSDVCFREHKSPRSTWRVLKTSWY